MSYVGFAEIYKRYNHFFTSSFIIEYFVFLFNFTCLYFQNVELLHFWSTDDFICKFYERFAGDFGVTLLNKMQLFLYLMGLLFLCCTCLCIQIHSIYIMSLLIFHQGRGGKKLLLYECPKMCPFITDQFMFMEIYEALAERVVWLKIRILNGSVVCTYQQTSSILKMKACVCGGL